MREEDLRGCVQGTRVSSRPTRAVPHFAGRTSTFPAERRKECCAEPETPDAYDLQRHYRISGIENARPQGTARIAGCAHTTGGVHTQLSCPERAGTVIALGFQL